VGLDMYIQGSYTHIQGSFGLVCVYRALLVSIALVRQLMDLWVLTCIYRALIRIYRVLLVCVYRALLVSVARVR